MAFFGRICSDYANNSYSIWVGVTFGAPRGSPRPLRFTSIKTLPYACHQFLKPVFNRPLIRFGKSCSCESLKGYSLIPLHFHHRIRRISDIPNNYNRIFHRHLLLPTVPMVEKTSWCPNSDHKSAKQALNATNPYKEKNCVGYWINL